MSGWYDRVLRGEPVAVDVGGPEAAGLGAKYVEGMGGDHHDLSRLAAEALCRLAVDARRRLEGANLLHGDYVVELDRDIVSQQLLEVPLLPVGEGHQAVAPGQGPQTLYRVVVGTEAPVEPA